MDLKRLKRTIKALISKCSDAFRSQRYWQQRCFAAERLAAHRTVEADSARAQLCQLRVAQEEVRGRIGWMVGCFIPDGAIKRLEHLGEQVKRDFKASIVDALVSNALNGIHRRTREGKLTAMLFVPIGGDMTKVEIFERDEKYHAVAHVEKDVAEYKRLHDPRYFSR